MKRRSGRGIFDLSNRSGLAAVGSAGRFPCVALLAALLAGIAGAQEKPVETHALRLLPLGNRAPFRQEIRDGVRHEIDPPEGSLPPREVSAGAAAGDGEPSADSGEGARLRLGEASAVIPIPMTGDPPTLPPVVIRDKEANRIWLKPRLAGGPASMVLVWRSGKTWSQVRSLALDDSPAAVPQGSCRVVNVAATEVGVVWGKQRYRLLPGKSMLLRFAVDRPREQLGILYPDAKGALVPAISTTVDAEARTRRQFFVYRADRAEARRPIQVLQLADDR